MKAARLYGARDIRIDDIPEPPAPGPGEVVVATTSVGVCGSDLHTYEDGRIGDTIVESPIILGHEFAGIVTAVGPGAVDGHHNPLKVGQRVALDPAVPCWQCEMCETGHPNLCMNLKFYGLWPDHGALQESMICAARGCFPIPDAVSNAAGAMLEPLGVAIHATDLGKLKVARSVAVLGAGPIGLLITRLARLSGANPIYVFDKFPWRVEKALEWGATNAWTLDEDDSVARIHDITNGRGVDVVFEAAWAGEAIQQSVEMARLGGRVVFVGIPGDNALNMKHSTVRRKGLTMMMTRRMKHSYPRAINLYMSGMVNLEDIISHRMSLDEADRAYAMNAAYEEGVHKIVIDVKPETS